MTFWPALVIAMQGAVPLFEIPQSFWGEFNEQVADCGTGNNDSRLRVSWDRLHFYESVGGLREFPRNSDGSIIVVAEQSGEGQRWTSIYQLRLSADGSRLTVIHPQTSETEQTETVRLRCPSSGAN
jgi:hypothetical protein